MRTTFEEGTELQVDSEEPAYNAGWSDSPSTDVLRVGALVAVAVRAKNVARAAWAEKSKYALGAMVTEGGKTYRLIKAEPEAEKSKPTTDAGVHWEEVASPSRIFTLPPEYRPAADLQSSDGKLEVKANGEVIALSSAGELETSSSRTFTTTYRAAVASP